MSPEKICDSDVQETDVSRKTDLKKLDAIGFDELTDFIAETVHTSFRKGCDGGGSHEVWSAIRKMEPKQWASACDWMIEALRVSTGRENLRKETEEALPKP